MKHSSTVADMKFLVPLLALLQMLLHSAGGQLQPWMLQSMSNQGLRAALTEVNSLYARSHLYRVTRASVKKIKPMGPSSIILQMVFGIRETECARNSQSDPQTCAFRAGFFVPSFSCSSQLKISDSSTQVLSLKCGGDSSSSEEFSEESSEEMYRGRHRSTAPVIHRGTPASPAPPSPSPPREQPDDHRKKEEVQPRGDTFSNFLE